MKKTMNKFGFAYAMVLPSILALVIVQLIPNIQGLYISFLKLNQFTFKKFLKAPFAGLQNYYDVLVNPDSIIRAGLFESIRNSVIFTVVMLLATIVFGLVLALILNQEFKGRSLARTLLLLPWVVPTYIVGLLAGFMWGYEGIINRILVDVLHILPEPLYWKSGSLALVTIIITTLWRFFPMTMLMYLAALQGIPKDFYEAADIDGATALQKFRYITLPALKPVTAMMVLFGLIQHVYSFNIASMMFGNGAGYPGEWGDLVMTNLNRNSFALMQYGTGGAASIILMFFVIGFVAIWLRVFKDSITIE